MLKKSLISLSVLAAIGIVAPSFAQGPKDTNGDVRQLNQERKTEDVGLKGKARADAQQDVNSQKRVDAQDEKSANKSKKGGKGKKKATEESTESPTAEQHEAKGETHEHVGHQMKHEHHSKH